MSFSVITKNLNWEIFSENLVTFKRQGGVKDEKLILWWFTEKSNFQGGGVMKKQYIGGIADIKGGGGLSENAHYAFV